jgi:PPM family protein phosphatase
MALCPHCGFASADPERCDRCRRAVHGHGTPTALPPTITLDPHRTLDCSAWNGAWPADPWRPLVRCAGGRAFRLYALSPAWWRDLSALVRRRADRAVDVLAPVQVHAIAGGAVVLAEGLPAGEKALRPSAYPDPDAVALLAHLLDEVRTLGSALQPLHEAGLLWLNFDPQALECAGGRLQVTNLDLHLFPAGEAPEFLQVSPAYCAPETYYGCPEQVGPATDVFHLGLYAYYRLAGLLPGGFPGQGLPAFDFALPPLRVYRPRLPPGVVPVLERALALDPADRFDSVVTFVDALAGAVDSVRRRYAPRPAPACDAGALSVAGRAKSAVGRPNQDCYHLQPLEGGGVLMIVADGVSHARIGSGEKASSIACRVLADFLTPALGGAGTPQEVEALLTETCHEASRAIARAALGLTPWPPDADAADLMSTTALVGVLRGNTLTLAGVGDSRAYLITAGVAEQLTVDGDVRCAHLAAGAPPEEVLGLGEQVQALYACLGIVEPGPDGAIECVLERSTPQVMHVPLEPGDVVLLCSDGLVEEAAFLEPSEAAAVVAGGPELSAQALAERLVAAADAKQRLPSPDEPDGFGDNITCVVLRVPAGPAREGEAEAEPARVARPADNGKQAGGPSE